jgi:hypothetical protein
MEAFLNFFSRIFYCELSQNYKRAFCKTIHFELLLKFSQNLNLNKLELSKLLEKSSQNSNQNFIPKACMNVLRNNLSLELFTNFQKKSQFHSASNLEK